MTWHCDSWRAYLADSSKSVASTEESVLYSRPISRLLVHEGHMKVSERVAGIRIALYSENMFGHSLDKRSDNLLRYAVHLMLQLGSKFIE